MNDSPLVRLDGFGVAFGDRIVLADLSLDIGRLGLTSLVGPPGGGKSTLIRTLAGLNDPHPAFTQWGEAFFDGRPLEVRRNAVSGELRPGVGMVVQHARFFLDSVRETLLCVLPNRGRVDAAAEQAFIEGFLAEHQLEELSGRLQDPVAGLSTALQRRLALARAVASEPPLLLVDEPTSGLNSQEAEAVLGLLNRQALKRSVVVILHDQRMIRRLGGQTVLLAGGRVQEAGPTEEFFAAPRTDNGRAYLNTGGCPVPSPNALPEDLDESLPPPPPLPQAAHEARRRSEGPRGFFWVEPGKMGGLPRPGIIEEVERDVASLGRLGITTLVTLEEKATVDPALLARYGIRSVHFPIVDMGAPTLEAAQGFCEDLGRAVAKGEVVAMHCLAGQGRTGTMLASRLIASGASASEAIERVRRISPRCIQSQVQVDFLSSFEAYRRELGQAAAVPV